MHSPTPQQGAPVGDAQSLATAVIRGDYSNDPQRRQLLGNRYSEVMAIVNQRLRGTGGGTSTSASWYTVQRGDYLTLIGAGTGVNWVSIANLNGLRAPYVIYPGQRLRLTGTTSSTSAGAGRYVVIGAGDCLWNHFGANSAKVAAANSISNPNQVRAGTRIYY